MITIYTTTWDTTSYRQHAAKELDVNKGDPSGSGVRL